MRLLSIAISGSARVLPACALAMSLTPACALAQVTATGGAAAPAAAIDVSHAGGSGAPTGQGTGGSEYGFLAPARHKALGRRHPAAFERPVKPARKRTPKPARKPAHKPSPKPAPKTAPAPKPPASPGGEAPTGVPTPAQTLADGAVFPVRGGSHSFGTPEDRFGAPRGDHTHQGQDILAEEGLDDIAPLPGTIIATGNQPGAAGWYVAERTSIGFDLFFAHCEAGSVLVKEGESVSPGTVLCKLGSTGDATGPHLHFEMWVGGWQAKGGYPIDPLPYLEAWEGH
ncbi:MAG: M23 family metallopeptidase [Solirubrobacteraceae bacterium]